jgi:hypothetical protein
MHRVNKVASAAIEFSIYQVFSTIYPELANVELPQGDYDKAIRIPEFHALLSVPYPVTA